MSQNKKVLVLYHNDADGFGAAYALWKKYRDGAHYIPVQYQEDQPEIPEGVEKIYIVDFSYSRGILEELNLFYEVLVIDHHKTAQEALADLPFAIFDTQRSGAVLTWETIHDTKAPDLLYYVQDRDLWLWELPLSEEINLGISALPLDFEVWDKTPLNGLLATGESIKKFRDQQIERTLKNVRMMSVMGHEVPAVNTNVNTSEVGDALCRIYPLAKFSVMYFDRQDGKRVFSLRSRGDFDVSMVARVFGGGGHKNAAGFVQPVEWLEVSCVEFIEAAQEVGLE